ncbi:hypothetical protein H7J71_23260 [Mycolicibacterium peregrinum]|uniref:hypothetical protein n=1 Tax=Mycolicibacterium peregrinum TaxID=43304 RepID=UPI0006D8067F|nr:hypothetical protein [Mycolicibacterium peregrinum]MCV7204936.1 hypothetical protein [Mycolicibacterium peregrinum]ORW59484.1 hypothetical protein AWC21_12275 [Mycolicibacterium peregrinum]
MNKKINIGVLAAAVMVTLTTACTPTPDPIAAPSSNATPSVASDREVKRAEAEAGKRELAILGVLGLPNGVDRIAAEAAAARGFPYLFSHGEGCSWVRTSDAALWRMYGTDGGQLVRDTEAEKAFHGNAGASDLWTCSPAANVPTADDPAATTPYQFVDERGTWVRVGAAVYLVPEPVPTRGAVPHLRSESGEVVPLPTN